MKYKLNPILKKLLEDFLSINYDDYIIFATSSILNINIYILFDKKNTKFLRLSTRPSQKEIAAIGECESVSILGLKGYSENNKEISVFNFNLAKNKTISNFKETENGFAYYLGDYYAEVDNYIFEMDDVAETYFKIGGEIEVISIFGE